MRLFFFILIEKLLEVFLRESWVSLDYRLFPLKETSLKVFWAIYRFYGQREIKFMLNKFCDWISLHFWKAIEVLFLGRIFDGGYDCLLFLLGSILFYARTIVNLKVIILGILFKQNKNNYHLDLRILFSFDFCFSMYIWAREMFSRAMLRLTFLL